MTSSSADAPAHEPDPQPAPTLDSVVAALVEGRSELSDEQFSVLSDLGPPDAARFRDALAGLDAPARFVLLNRLVERERAGRLLDFSASTSPPSTTTTPASAPSSSPGSPPASSRR